ncbi:MAG TPA: diacylglycerol kinase family protein [Caldilineaceae bacterium]|nr:diacylglycerol kinase family protein [Caldilineaceae bacterium]
MQAHIIFNPTSGIIKQRHKLEDLHHGLAQAGFTPIHHPTACEADLDGLLDQVNGLVVAAGGDGTVRAVASRLRTRKLPLAIVPMGTANNIAYTLGIQDLKPRDLAGLAVPERRAFDLGLVWAPWGEDIFLEGAGFGFFADVLSTYDPAQGKSILRSLSTVIDTARRWQSYPCRLVLDEDEVMGDFVLVEMLNTRAIGPRLHLAPEADPYDGLLDVALVRNEAQESLLRYLVRGVAGGLDQLPNVEYRRARRLEIAWSGFPLHVDAEVRPRAGWSSPAHGLVTIEVQPRALEIWLPGKRAE